MQKISLSLVFFYLILLQPSIFCAQPTLSDPKNQEYILRKLTILALLRESSHQTDPQKRNELHAYKDGTYSNVTKIQSMVEQKKVEKASQPLTPQSPRSPLLPPLHPSSPAKTLLTLSPKIKGQIQQLKQLPHLSGRPLTSSSHRRQ